MTATALAALTADWQPFRDLHAATGIDFRWFDQLARDGLAESRQELLTRHGLPAGNRFWFRLPAGVGR